MHLGNMEMLAEYVGISRQAMQAIVAYGEAGRSNPRTETAIKLAEAFGVSLNALYQEPIACLKEAVSLFENAPHRSVRGEEAVASNRPDGGADGEEGEAAQEAKLINNWATSVVATLKAA
jgi:DNA-binding XRE family transcriptional regulator